MIQKEMIQESNLDFAGMVASAICAVHCAIVPVLITVGSLSGGHWLHNHAFDYFFIALGLVVAGFALIRARAKHGNSTPIIIAALGFATLIGAQLDHGIMHSVLGVTGGLLIIVSHYYNYRLSHKH